jgi:hypothetical protein
MANLASIHDVLNAYREYHEVDSLDLNASDLDYDTRAVSGIRRQPSDRSRSAENRMRDLGRFQARRAKAQGGAYA